jgi:hypothetical protein
VAPFKKLESSLKMKLSNPREIFNLDDFIPPDGEDRFEIADVDSTLNLDIFYEPDDPEFRLARLRICFDQAKYFFKAPLFSGYSFFNCPDDRKLELLNSLVEYEESDLLDLEHQSNSAIRYKHYRLFLLASGVAIHVIAQSNVFSNEGLTG